MLLNCWKGINKWSQVHPDSYRVGGPTEATP